MKLAILSYPRIMMYSIVVLAFFISVCTAAAEKLVTAVSSNIVWIDSNFTGAEIVLFGSISGDTQTISRKGGYNIIIILRGPSSKVTIWRKEQILGFWINRKSVNLINIPNYLGLFSNKPFKDITTDANLRHYQIGLQRKKPLNITSFQQMQEMLHFQNQIPNLMKARNLYIKDTHGVKFLNENLFISRFSMPANVPPGIYTAHTFLFRDEAMLDQKKIQIQIRKGGFEQMISHTALHHPGLYGVLSVLAALAIGWLGAVIFRRD